MQADQATLTSFAELFDHLRTAYHEKHDPQFKDVYQVYFSQLKSFDLATVKTAATELQQHHKWFPTVPVWVAQCKKVARDHEGQTLNLLGITHTAHQAEIEKCKQAKAECVADLRIRAKDHKAAIDLNDLADKMEKWPVRPPPPPKCSQCQDFTWIYKECTPLDRCGGVGCQHLYGESSINHDYVIRCGCKGGS